MNRMPEMKMQFSAPMPAMEFVNKNANKVAHYMKMGKSEVSDAGPSHQ